MAGAQSDSDELVEFDPQKLAVSTRKMFYDILEPRQRKAVIREVFSVYDKKTDQKLVSTNGAALVYEHQSIGDFEWVDQTCETLMIRHSDDVKLFSRQARDLAQGRFMREFHKTCESNQKQGWRWNRNSLTFKRTNNSTGKAAKAADKLEAEQQSRKRKLEDFEAQRSDKQKKPREDDARRQ